SRSSRRSMARSSAATSSITRRSPICRRERTTWPPRAHTTNARSPSRATRASERSWSAAPAPSRRDQTPEIPWLRKAPAPELATSRLTYAGGTDEVLAGAVGARLAAGAAGDVLISDRADLAGTAAFTTLRRAREVTRAAGAGPEQLAAFALRARDARFAVAAAGRIGLAEEARRAVAAAMAVLRTARRLTTSAAARLRYARLRVLERAAALTLAAAVAACIRRDAVGAIVGVVATSRAI